MFGIFRESGSVHPSSKLLLESLKEDLNIENSKRLVFMTDKQKGLGNAIAGDLLLICSTLSPSLFIYF